jgi:hypothetical protein
LCLKCIVDVLLEDEDLGIRILSEALNSSTHKFVEEGAPKILASAIGLAVAGPLGAGLGAVAGELIKALFEKASLVEVKLDVVLKEPFETAMRTVREARSVPRATPESYWEYQRQLTLAYDLLGKAYTYAEFRKPFHRLEVRLYQCLVAAFRPGSHEFVDLYVAEFRSVALAAAVRSNEFAGMAAELDPAIAHAKAWLDAVIDAQSASEDVGASGEALYRLTSQQAAAKERAAQLAAEAVELNLFADFALKISATTLAEARLRNSTN